MNIKSLILLLFLLPLTACSQVEKIRAVYLDNPSYNIDIQWVGKKNLNYAIYFDTEKNYHKNNCLRNVKLADTSYKYKGMYHYFVKLKNLTPDTKYYFQIQNNNYKSPIYWFKTMPLNPERISIIAGGDSRTHRKIRRKANIAVAKLQPDFVIFDGDFTTTSSAKEWKKWLDDWQLTIADSGHIIPLVIVQGNHEQSKDIEKIFQVKHNAYYDIKIGNNFLQIFALNTQEKIPGAQTQWFINELKKSNAHWKIVAYHKPMRPHYSEKKEGIAQIRYWAYPIYNYGVQLVLEGDTHVCKWTYPIKPDTTAPAKYQSFLRDDKNGTVYIGEGTWGAPLRQVDDIKPWTRDAAAINQFKWLFIDKKQIQIRTVLYENAENITGLKYNNRYTIPKGIKFWQPPHGSLLTIKYHNKN